MQKPYMFKYRHLRAWHALCLSFSVSGCFYWKPFDQVYPNAAPTIEYSNPEATEVLRISGAEGGVAWVSVFDPDEGDVMDYLWTINGLGPQGSAQTFVSGNYQGSSIQLPFDTVLNGRTLTCTVYDQAGASDRRSWAIEVGGGS
jgi:hypothetical protein